MVKKQRTHAQGDSGTPAYGILASTHNHYANHTDIYIHILQATATSCLY